VHFRRSFLAPSIADTTPSFTFTDDASLFCQAIKKPVGLRSRDLAQFSRFTAADPSVLFHVLQYHLLLLHRFKPALADVGGFLSQTSGMSRAE